MDISMDTSQQENAEDDFDLLCSFVNEIAQPLASKKLCKKLYKLVKKASAQKTYTRQGIVDVQRGLRKGETGVLILAGDVSPMDVYSHIPAVCESKDIPYVFTPSRKHLGLATGHKRAVIAVLVRKNDDFAELYDQVQGAIKELPIAYT